MSTNPPSTEPDQPILNDDQRRGGQAMTALRKTPIRPGTFRDMRPSGRTFTSTQYRVALTFGIDLERVNVDRGTAIDEVMEIELEDGTIIEVRKGNITFVSPYAVDDSRLATTPPRAWVTENGELKIVS